MASINGMSIRGYSEEETHRGIAYRGTLSIDGKNVGYFEHKGEGGDVDIHCDGDNQQEFEKRVKTYFEQHPATMDDAEGFINELINLMIAETQFKEKVEGIKGILVEGHRMARNTSLDDITDLDQLGIDFYVAQSEADVDEILKQHHPAWHRVYRDASDFNL